MSTMTDLAPHTSGGQPSGLAFEGEIGDRTKDFEKARRHSKHVRLLRLTLPVVTVVITGLYVFSVLKTAGVGENIPSLALPNILPTDLAMHNPHYEGYAKDGSMYHVKADTATPNLKTPNLIELHGITAELIDTQKQKTILTAKGGLFDNKKSILTLRDGINIKGQDGLNAKLQSAVVNSKTNVITSQDPVEVAFPAGTVRSDKLILKQKQKHVLFSENVKANLKPPPRKNEPSAKPKPQDSQSKNQMFVGSNTPIAITSNTLDIYDGEKRALFKGTVTARQGLATLSTPELEASYDTGSASTTQGKSTSGAASGFSSTGGKLRRILAKGPVVMTQGPQDRVTCNAADFDALNETAVLSGNVIMSSGPGRNARSDRVDLNQGQERAVLSGNVVVTQDKNVLKGRRLEVDQRNGITRLTSPAGVGYGAGRISARFIQSGKKKNATRKASSSGPTGAFRADPNAPLDITASQLLVRDKIKKATFSGKVQARQGDFKIASSKLHAFYAGSAALGNVASRSTPQAVGATALTKVRAEHKVLITGTDGQQVTGDWADFDVAAGKAVVGGAVEIRQAGNVIQGTRLTIDTKTGRTIIETAPKNTTAKPQGGGWVTKNNGRPGQTAAQRNSGRPSAVFYLNDIEKARKGRSSKKKPSTGSAWQAQTAPR